MIIFIKILEITKVNNFKLEMDISLINKDMSG